MLHSVENGSAVAMPPINSQNAMLCTLTPSTHAQLSVQLADHAPSPVKRFNPDSFNTRLVRL